MTAAKMQGYAYVGDKRVAEAMVSCQLVDSSRGRGSTGSDGNAEWREKWLLIAEFAEKAAEDVGGLSL